MARGRDARDPLSTRARAGAAQLARVAAPASALLSALAASMDSGPGQALALLTALALLALAWRTARASVRLLLLGGLLTLGTAALQENGAAVRRSTDDAPGVAANLERVRARFDATASALRRAAEAVATRPETRATLLGAPQSRTPLFDALHALDPGDDTGLMVSSADLTPLAWAGRPLEPASYLSAAPDETALLVLRGPSRVVLVALVPLRDQAGHRLGLASAERVLQARQTLQPLTRAALDHLAGDLPGVTLSFFDTRTPLSELPAPPPQEQHLVLSAPDGRPLVLVEARADGAAKPRPLALGLRRAAALLLLLALVAWGYLGQAPLGARALATTLGLRALLAWLGPPWPASDSVLLAPDVYASPALGALLRSPLDLLLTALAAVHVAMGGLAALLRQPPAQPSLVRLGLAGLLLPVVLGLPFVWLGDTVANSVLALDTPSLAPDGAAHALLQVACLLELALGALLLTTLMVLASPAPRTWGMRLAWLALWGTSAVVAFQLWPRARFGLPLLPALLLLGSCALLGFGRARWPGWLAMASPERRALCVPALVAVLAALLQPSLVHFGEKELRRQVQHDEAPRILRQPQWRDFVLEQTCKRLDDASLLAQASMPGGLQDRAPLAFGLWSSTELASYGFSSALEVRDTAGRLLSRFALDLPSLDQPPPAAPSGDAWEVAREQVRVGSAERAVLHARRGLADAQGHAWGALHVYVADDFWNLPFLPARSPYASLYSPVAPADPRGRALVLMAYDRARVLQFASHDQPPTLDEALLARLREERDGFWTTLALDGRPYHTFVFADAQAYYALGYPRRLAARQVADLVEATVAFTLLALVLLVMLLALRSLLGRHALSLDSAWAAVQRRFRLRLFVAFVGVSMLPVAVLQGVVQTFVAERLRKEADDQALERASVAQKALEDYVVYQRQDAEARVAVNDAALVWVASLIRNDLDVFEDGRLVASSKRELYASGLLPTRLSGRVFRDLVLTGGARAVSEEQVAGSSSRVVCVPMRLHGREPGVLRVPLPQRSREWEGVLLDLQRIARLASVAFVLLAAGLAQSLARRISGPVGALTAAARRVAAGDLSARVSANGRDELRALVEAFNQMTADLERQRGELERSNRLAAWADMARQVAHEVKNPLTPIQLSAEHLRRVWRDPQVDFGAALESCTATILKQVRSLRDMVTEFSAFARPPLQALEPLDLATLLRDCLAPYLAAPPPAVSLTLHVPETPLTVLGEARLLSRAVVNLLENALQAVGGSGTVSLRLELRGHEAVVEVLDSGPGIAPELRERIFEPFFSTKTSGTGLGLALVRKIALEHGGQASIDSQPGRTSARLHLPLGTPRG
jgi:signal transduction histidine kinase